MSEPSIEFYAEIKDERERAYLVFDGGHTVWLPKSKVIALRRIGNGHDVELTIPEWLARQKGII